MESQMTRWGISFIHAFVVASPMLAYGQPASLDGPPQLTSMPALAVNRLVSGARPGNSLWTIPLTSLKTTREKPLFSESRRPPSVVQAAPTKAATVAVAPSQPARPLLSLLGAIAADSEGIAIVLDESNRNILRLRPGEQFGGWTLRSVEKRSARFEKSDQIAVLTIPSP